MNNTTKPSDQPPTDNAWDDLDITPVAPSKERHNAQYLYNNRPSTSNGMGLALGWVNHPAAIPVVLVGLIALGTMTVLASRSDASKLAAANAQAHADMVQFKKGLEAAGLQRTCLVTMPSQVPAQYVGDCEAVRAAAKAKGGRP